MILAEIETKHGYEKKNWQRSEKILRCSKVSSRRENAGSREEGEKKRSKRTTPSTGPHHKETISRFRKRKTGLGGDVETECD